MQKLEEINFDPVDFASLKETVLGALLHPDIRERRRYAMRLGDMQIVYNPYKKAFCVGGRLALLAEASKYPIFYDIEQVGIDERIVFMDLIGNKMQPRMTLCDLPETYIRKVEPDLVIPLLKIA